ncbi:MAG TPA: hypothetical protein VM934_09080 [Pyrinomonadaceae bacterium]|jgi:hypothetical protein|nr:hypothetical protein [Pyrinomonadaceae bacterium]
MKLRFDTCALTLTCALLLSGCASEPTPSTNGAQPPGTAPAAGNTSSAGSDAGGASQPGTTKITSALPESGFKASLTIADPPTKLRAGQTQLVEVRVKNASPNAWPALGADDARYAITLRNRWLEAGGGDKVVNDIDGGASLPNDLGPGAEAVIPLKITAPKKPGEYVLEFDMVQEQVTFFRDKGSETAKVNVRVE